MSITIYTVKSGFNTLCAACLVIPFSDIAALYLSFFFAKI